MRSHPGCPPYQKNIASILRVNLAGEYGAKRIYEGQLAILKHSASAPILRHMMAQENAHLKTFETWVVKNHVRPTLLQPLWHVAGFALGAATALLGEKAAMACTVAIEEVIDEHYENQLIFLEDKNPKLSNLILSFQQEEREHRNLALEQGAMDTPAYPILSHTIKIASRLAIWLSERI